MQSEKSTEYIDNDGGHPQSHQYPGFTKLFQNCLKHNMIRYELLSVMNIGYPNYPNEKFPENSNELVFVSNSSILMIYYS